MIIKERLEELIKEQATIYFITSEPFIAGASSFIGIQEIKYNAIPTFWKKHWEDYKDWMYETKEEAEWYLEFGNITRTETLKLPSWEEFNKNSYFQFVSKDMSNIVLAESGYLEIDEYIDGEFIQTYFHKEMNKENYIEACRMAKKLFLGEEV